MHGFNKSLLVVARVGRARLTPAKTGLEGSPIDQTSRGAHRLRNARIRAPTAANELRNPRVIAPTGLSTDVPEPHFQPP